MESGRVMATKTFCDRCGEEIDPMVYVLVDEHQYDNRHRIHTHRVILCEQCKIAYGRFLKGDQ